VVTKRARRGRRPFWGCDRYPDCDYASWTRPQPASAESGEGEMAAAAGGARG
jgi:ssDNA-binding Zn-finger/Zn-ribbon topoisomerase 1